MEYFYYKITGINILQLIINIFLNIKFLIIIYINYILLIFIILTFDIKIYIIYILFIYNNKYYS